MYLDLMDALRAPGNIVQRAIDIAPEELDETGVVAPVQGIVRAQNGRQNLLVSGVAGTNVEMQCARCLRMFTQPMQVELEAVAPMSLFAETTGTEADAGEEDESLDDELAAIFSGHTVDVTELVRQSIEMQRPIAPLCSLDCPGLPEAHGYHEEADPRWDALRRMSEQFVNGDVRGENKRSGNGIPPKE